MEKDYLFFCNHKGLFTVSLQKTKDKGATIADMLKAGFAIYSAMEFTEEEATSFKTKMSEKVIPPKKGLTLLSNN